MNINNILHAHTILKSNCIINSTPFPRKHIPVNKAVYSMLKNTLYLLLHFFFFCLFYFCYLCCRVHSNTRAKDLNQRKQRVQSKKELHLQKHRFTTVVMSQTLILSVSIPVFAIRIFAFSILFGWFTPIFLSSKKPVVTERSCKTSYSKRRIIRLHYYKTPSNLLFNLIT